MEGLSFDNDFVLAMLLGLVLFAISVLQTIGAIVFTTEAFIYRLPKRTLLAHWLFVLIPVIFVFTEGFYAGIMVYIIMSPFLASILYHHKKLIKPWPLKKEKEIPDNSN